MAAFDTGSNRIFISYRRADASWPARWLADQLAGQFGPDVVFQDVDSIRPGDDFAAKIEAAAGSCSVLIAVIGPRWSRGEPHGKRQLDYPDDWVRLELEAAIRRKARIIPVLVDGAAMPVAADLPESLRVLARRQAVTLNPASLDIRRLVSVLENALLPGQWEGSRAPKPTQPAHPHNSRLLMEAIHDASAVTGDQKAYALAAVIRAAALTAPERVRWLTAEAEAAARSIKDPRSQAHALSDVAQSQPVRSPGTCRACSASSGRAFGRSERVVMILVPWRGPVSERDRRSAISRSGTTT